MATLLVGLTVGTTIGAVATYVLVVDPLRRQRAVWRKRIIEEQLRTFAAEAHLSAYKHINADTPGHNAGSLKEALRLVGGHDGT